MLSYSNPRNKQLLLIVLLASCEVNNGTYIVSLPDPLYASKILTELGWLFTTNCYGLWVFVATITNDDLEVYTMYVY